MPTPNQSQLSIFEEHASPTRYFLVVLSVEERAGITRRKEPVTVGIPLPKGAVVDPSHLGLLDASEQSVVLQTQLLAKWPDGSVKWVLLDFQADVDGHHTAAYSLHRVPRRAAVGAQARMTVQTSPDCITVETGRAAFFIDRRTLKLFDRVVVEGTEILDGALSRIQLVDDRGREYLPRIVGTAVETEGPVRVTVHLHGKMHSSDEKTLADFSSRLSFYADSDLVEMKFTLRNSRPARHLGGLWDLGDEGSIYFRDLSVQMGLPKARGQNIRWCPGPGLPWLESPASDLQIYQDSSGGKNWNSSNHVNRFGQIGSRFRGYRVTAGETLVQDGDRITPTMSVRSEAGSLSVAIEGFWQNFPKGIEADGNQITVGLFPRQFQDVYELQGGEQKTHTVYFSFQGFEKHDGDLDWVHHRIAPRAPLAWYSESKAIGYLVPRTLTQDDSKPLALLERLVDTAVVDGNSFFDRREIIDEYGWRNFGDLYADHEAVGHAGEQPRIAHYNNQYDVIHGAIIEYLRSGNTRWFELATDLAKHLIDIDIYHTSEDRDAFNGGLFWHTQHYADAATATHRTYSRTGLGEQNRYQAGGGPSNEHNYTTGLLHCYFLTGDPAAKDAVQGLADWVINMDRRSRGLLGIMDRRPRGLASMTVSWNYHGPGRGCGNSINALLDAYLLTRHEKYLDKAEELIRRSIHPRDKIKSRNLEDVEHRWSYTVFLQSLGKYLDVKTDEGRLDYMCAYGRESLLHYARWMLDREVPYKEVLDKVEIPTETWPAQDIRKSNVFNFAAKYSDASLRARFLERAEFFFERCLKDLSEFSTCTLTRPIALLMTNGYMQSCFANRRLEAAPCFSGNYDFGEPRAFKPQFSELRQARQKIIFFLGIMSDVKRYAWAMLRRKQRPMVGERV